jgi:hypothetical protein
MLLETNLSSKMVIYTISFASKILTKKLATRLSQLNLVRLDLDNKTDKLNLQEKLSDSIKFVLDHKVFNTKSIRNLPFKKISITMILMTNGRISNNLLMTHK